MKFIRVPTSIIGVAVALWAAQMSMGFATASDRGRDRPMKNHHAAALSHRRLDGRGSRLGLAALGVTPSYGYGDDYPAYGGAPYNDNERAGHIIIEGRAAAIDEDAPNSMARESQNPYLSPGSTYGRHGRQTPNYGPGVTYAAPVSPYRWAYNSEQFPGTEFMGGR